MISAPSTGKIIYFFPSIVLISRGSFVVKVAATVFTFVEPEILLESNVDFGGSDKVISFFSKIFFKETGSSSTGVSCASSNSEISSRIYQAIETLPGQCREVTRMAYILGLKNQEIADCLQISINSVRAHKQRAIQLLRDKLDKKDLLLMIIFEKKLNFL